MDYFEHEELYTYILFWSVDLQSLEQHLWCCAGFLDIGYHLSGIS